MPRNLSIPPDALARHNMLKEACKNPPTTDQTPAVEDRQPRGGPPRDVNPAASAADREKSDSV